MSRSATDATRFTATSPHAYSKPGTFRSTAQNVHRDARRGNAPGAPGASGGHNGRGPQGDVAETPQQKVARLRAAHAAKRMAEVSKWDRIVARGRTVADSAHKITVVSLVGLSAIAGLVTIYSFWDLSRYNRQKQKEWLARQYENLQAELIEASKAERKGVATPEQMLLLNRERAAEQSRQEKENRKGIMSSITGLFSTQGLKKEESGDVSLQAAARDSATPDSITASSKVDSIESITSAGAGSLVAQALKQSQREGAAATSTHGGRGGQLDQIAASATEKAKQSASYWTSWLGPK